MGGAEVAEQLEPVSAVQRQVEQHEIGVGVPVDELPTRFRSGGVEYQHVRLELGEHVTQRFKDQRMVVDNEDLDEPAATPNRVGRRGRTRCGRRAAGGERIRCLDHGAQTIRMMVMDGSNPGGRNHSSGGLSRKS